jgi:hypothetical protein
MCNGKNFISLVTTAFFLVSTFYEYFVPGNHCRRIEQNRIAALERLQESRRKREEETSRMMQQYNL